MNNQTTSLIEKTFGQMVEWRRDFHKFAESGWLEFRTASLVASKLEAWGYEVKAGKEVVRKESRMGVPSASTLEENEKRALEQGADPKWLPYFSGGLTGVVGTLDSGRPGPAIGLRFDMDALDIQESNDEEHVPVKEGFVSINANMMHACGHDAHTAIGLGLAKLLSESKDQLSGKIVFIFQPAEEGVRGAKSMVEAGVLDEVDIFFASHVGTGIPLGEVVSGSDGFLATTKLDVTYKGKAAHAGANPEAGNNALLAAASAVMNLHAISRHSEGSSRINVGVLQAGSGRNIIPASAHLKIETRGETTEINEYILKNALSIIKGAAVMYETEAVIDVVGEAKTSESNKVLKEYIKEITEKIDEVEHVLDDSPFAAGSEDATYMMERVKNNNGLASYIIFGTSLAAGHHNERFDIDESVMRIALKALSELIINIERVEGVAK
ncbi:amidohydrolase [Cytobacillus sp. NJ13]|nr:amidohydrolase [Cytobacillus sp. NJ13]